MENELKIGIENFEIINKIKYIDFQKFERDINSITNKNVSIKSIIFSNINNLMNFYNISYCKFVVAFNRSDNINEMLKDLINIKDNELYIINLIINKKILHIKKDVENGDLYLNNIAEFFIKMTQHLVYLKHINITKNDVKDYIFYNFTSYNFKFDSISFIKDFLISKENSVNL